MHLGGSVWGGKTKSSQRHRTRSRGSNRCQQWGSSAGPSSPSNGRVNIFGAPPVEGLGTAGGFRIVVLDTGDNGLAALQQTADHVIGAAGTDPQLQGRFSSFRADTPWLELVIDRAQAKDRGVSIDDVRTTLESTLGPFYINDFNRFGRTWQVNVQAQSEFRETPDDLKQLKVRNHRDEMVPLASFAAVRYVSGPVMITRYNLYQAAPIQAEAGPATSSGQPIAALESPPRGSCRKRCAPSSPSWPCCSCSAWRPGGERRRPADKAPPSCPI